MLPPPRRSKIPESRNGSAPIGRTFGFTLSEVMVVVVIVGVMAAIALPSYFDYVRESKIVEATTNLADMRTRLEQHFFDHGEYPGDCIPVAAGPAPEDKIYLPASTEFFTFACSTLTPATYTVTATGKATEGMAGFVYTVDQANARLTIATPWGKTSASQMTSCWITQRDGSC